jgi:hypothetical protein
MQVNNEFSFIAPLEPVKIKHITSAVYLPHHIIIDLPKGRLRVSGTLNGAPFSLAIRHRRDGSRFFTVGASLRKTAGIEPGDQVCVFFRILNLEKVEFPGEFEYALRQESEARKIGRQFSNAGKYEFIHYIEDIKNMDVRMRRSIEKIRRARLTTLQPQQNKKKNK